MQETTTFTGMTIKAIHPKGFPVQFTLYEIGHLAEALTFLEASGYTPPPTHPFPELEIVGASQSVGSGGQSIFAPHTVQPKQSSTHGAAPTMVEVAKQRVANAERVTSATENAAAIADRPPASSQPTFDATELVPDIKPGGAMYWLVRGGDWSTFGVRIWPEVLITAGFDPLTMRRDVLTALIDAEEGATPPTIELTGYTATYQLDPSTGKPKKITKLIQS